MLSKDQNDLVCRTGPGTPMGEVMRRYWQPVGLSGELGPGGKPKQVKAMGEDLVLFRDERGRPGLLGLHCSHRLTSLAYGRVEDGGIRCPFHGWLYDVEGRCLQQPAEPEPFAERVRHLSYPCEEFGGLIFAYMGPGDKKPLLPRYEVLVREDGTRKADYYVINSNYLQNLEGAVDTIHAPYLHVDRWSERKRNLASLPKSRVEFMETDYGIRQKTYEPDLTLSNLRPLYTYFFMPAGFIRIQKNPHVVGDVQKFQSWYLPIDDTHTRRFQVGFTPIGKDGKPYTRPGRDRGAEKGFVQPGPENDYFRNYEEVDTISGIPGDAPGTSVKGFLVQDNMVNESQGAIADRSGEHLGAHDKVLTAVRLMLLLAAEDVRKGNDPKHIIREPRQNGILYFRDAEEEAEP